jgi:ribosomal protein S12 methylthiotransferase accessory factor
VSHALCEVVERDATTLWKHRSPAARDRRVLDPASIDDAACRSVLAQLAAADLQAQIWDATSDLGIASFICLVVGRDGDNADPEFGAGCHPSRNIALLRALTEAAQARNTYIAGARDDYSAQLYSDPVRARRLAFCRRLLASVQQRRAFADVPSFESSSIEDDMRWMLARLRAAGIHQVIAVDLTREAIGIPVARVIVPGLEGMMEDEDGDYLPGPRARRCLKEPT